MKPGNLLQGKQHALSKTCHPGLTLTMIPRELPSVCLSVFRYLKGFFFSFFLALINQKLRAVCLFCHYLSYFSKTVNKLNCLQCCVSPQACFQLPGCHSVQAHFVTTQRKRNKFLSQDACLLTADFEELLDFKTGLCSGANQT